MSESVQLVLEKALSLSINERVVLVEQLLVSLDQPDATIDQLWIEEAESRIQAYDAGLLEAIDESEVFA